MPKDSVVHHPAPAPVEEPVRKRGLIQTPEKETAYVVRNVASWWTDRSSFADSPEAVEQAVNKAAEQLAARLAEEFPRVSIRVAPNEKFAMFRADGSLYPEHGETKRRAHELREEYMPAIFKDLLSSETPYEAPPIPPDDTQVAGEQKNE